MKTIELTDEQAGLLSVYLLITTRSRNEECEACKHLAEELNEDGTERFSKMRRNAEWWENTNAVIENIIKAIDEAK